MKPITGDLYYQTLAVCLQFGRKVEDGIFNPELKKDNEAIVCFAQDQYAGKPYVLILRGVRDWLGIQYFDHELYAIEVQYLSHLDMSY